MPEDSLESLIIKETPENSESLEDLIIREPLEETIEDAELASEDVSPDTEVFTPNPEGEAYYERLKARDGMMNAEVAAYENWKTKNKSKIKEVEDVKVNLLTNQPLVDVSEGTTLSYGLKISQDNPLFDKEIGSIVSTGDNLYTIVEVNGKKRLKELKK